MPRNFPFAAGAAAMTAALAGAYFFLSDDAPSTAVREVPAAVPGAGTAPDTDRRQVVAAALKAGYATCLKDLDSYRGTPAAQLQFTKPPELERYVEPELLAEVKGGADRYQRLSEHPKDLQRAFLALREATDIHRPPSVDEIGPPLPTPSAEAVPQQGAEAQRAERERLMQTLHGSEFDGGLIKTQRIEDPKPGAVPDAASQQDAEARARVQREETQRVVEELRRSSISASGNDLIVFEGGAGDGGAAKRKEELIVKMESFCADILEVARDL